MSSSTVQKDQIRFLGETFRAFIAARDPSRDHLGHRSVVVYAFNGLDPESAVFGLARLSVDEYRHPSHSLLAVVGYVVKLDSSRELVHPKHIGKLSESCFVSGPSSGFPLYPVRRVAVSHLHDSLAFPSGRYRDGAGTGPVLRQPHAQLFLILQRTVAEYLSGDLVAGQVVVSYELLPGLIYVGCVVDERFVLVHEYPVPELEHIGAYHLLVRCERKDIHVPVALILDDLLPLLKFPHGDHAVPVPRCPFELEILAGSLHPLLQDSEYLSASL